MTLILAHHSFFVFFLLLITFHYHLRSPSISTPPVSPKIPRDLAPHSPPILVAVTFFSFRLQPSPLTPCVSRFVSVCQVHFCRLACSFLKKSPFPPTFCRRSILSLSALSTPGMEFLLCRLFSQRMGCFSLK